MQFITGSQFGIHKVIGTWNTWGKHWHVRRGEVGRGGGRGWDGVGSTRQARMLVTGKVGSSDVSRRYCTGLTSLGSVYVPKKALSSLLFLGYEG